MLTIDELESIRIEVVKMIDFTYNDWLKVPTPTCAKIISKIMLSQGFDSLWIEKFKNEPIVLQAFEEMKEKYKDTLTYKNARNFN